MHDLVLINGKIVTVDRLFSVVQAAAIRSGKVIAVGSNKDMGAYQTAKTHVIDLKGRTVLPGINDSHIHASLLGSTLPPVVLDISAALSPSAVTEMVADKARKVEPGEWIRGVGIEAAFAGGKDRQLPTREDLDRVSPNNPVYLGVAPFHGPAMALANSKALEMAGIAPGVLDPAPNQILKGDSGGATELLLGRSLEALNAAVPPLTREQKKQAVKAAMRRLNELGITSITEPGLGPGGRGLYGGLWDDDCINIYRELSQRKELSLRVSILLLFTPYGAFDREMVYSAIGGKPLPAENNDEWVRLAGIKLYADGIPPMHTAWMSKDYPGGGNGKMVFPGADDAERLRTLDEVVRQAHNLGYQIGIHATGDRSISACISSFARAEEANPRGLRHYVVHGDFTQPVEGPLMNKFGIGLSVQPALAAGFLPLLRSAIGPSRANQQLALNSLVRAGVHVAGGSDSPVMSPDWRNGVQAAVLRESPDKQAFGPEEKLNLKQALRMYTVEGAWQDHMEDQKGSIEPGKLADLCVLDGNILDGDPHSVKDLHVAMTIVGGNIVYNAEA